jgi:hypothetical protein
MKKALIFTLVMCLMPGGIALAQSKIPVQMAEKFFGMVEKGKIGEAYDQLFQGSMIPVTKPQAVETMKKQTESGLSIFGKIFGYEKIREERFGSSILRLVYVVKSEKFPTVWEFYFYKAKNDWVLGNLKFNDYFQGLEALK